MKKIGICSSPVVIIVVLFVCSVISLAAATDSGAQDSPKMVYTAFLVNLIGV